MSRHKDLPKITCEPSGIPDGGAKVWLPVDGPPIDLSGLVESIALPAKLFDALARAGVKRSTASTGPFVNETRGETSTLPGLTRKSDIQISGRFDDGRIPVKRGDIVTVTVGGVSRRCVVTRTRMSKAWLKRLKPQRQSTVARKAKR